MMEQYKRHEYLHGLEGKDEVLSIISLKVDAVITGGIGTHGMKILEDAGIYVSYDEEGTAEQCITDFMRRMEHKRKFENQPSQ